ncbi:hypothetical protein HZQ15_18795 [Elizabethkingia anophelis]|nr:hypothetical protein [Elizabethkingia anophelis]MCT3835897.1 hypothetical protein [Elizabethkingia anophelis]MCT3874352.1 hypothetical protein [Elizabethkingia anophelis]MCT4042847.1 hypothetical protein [Elizabethkingia anophelis]
MENNLENKARFFAQYYSQEILTRDGGLRKFWKLGTDVSIESSLSRYGYDYRYYVELKSLEDITDDDLMTIAKYYEPTTYKVESNSDEIVFDYMYGDNFSSAAIGYDYGYALDYLRSKGYALPWMGLSVEKQIQYGWVKLKEKNDGK